MEVIAPPKARCSLGLHTMQPHPTQRFQIAFFCITLHKGSHDSDIETGAFCCRENVPLSDSWRRGVDIVLVVTSCERSYLDWRHIAGCRLLTSQDEEGWRGGRETGPYQKRHTALRTRGRCISLLAIGLCGQRPSACGRCIHHQYAWSLVLELRGLTQHLLMSR